MTHTIDNEKEIEALEAIECLSAKHERLEDWAERAHKKLVGEITISNYNSGLLASGALDDFLRRELAPELGDDFEAVRESRTLVRRLSWRTNYAKRILKQKGLMQ